MRILITVILATISLGISTALIADDSACVGITCPYGMGCGNGKCYPLDCSGCELTPCISQCSTCNFSCPQGKQCNQVTESCVVDCASCLSKKCTPDGAACYEDLCAGVVCNSRTHCREGACVANHCDTVRKCESKLLVCVDYECVPRNSRPRPPVADKPIPNDGPWPPLRVPPREANTTTVAPQQSR